MHDLVIRNGTVVDGTGQERFIGDVAVDAARITAVGEVAEKGRREIDARGLLVTPGFVDIHTHYDGQATWDGMLAPTSWHGVTSLVMGNCGVGFAPAAPDKHDFLISLMEGVEDIPGTALAEGLAWDWESLPEYLDAVDRRPHAVDIGSQVPHAALRAYVMGERGADHEIDPTADEIAEMARLTKEALLAGCLGFASSRTLGHRSRDGRSIGSLTASTEELLGIGQALKEVNKGVFQFVSDFDDVDYELTLLRRLAEECQRPLSVSLFQRDPFPDRWRAVLDHIERAARDGVNMKAQVAGRALGVLLGLQGTLQPFLNTPTYQEIADLKVSERVQRMRDPEVRQRIIAEQTSGNLPLLGRMAVSADKIFSLGDPPQYEPRPEESLAARASLLGVDPMELLYDLVLEDDGRALLYYPIANYAEFDLEVSRQMVTSEHTLFGLSDGGAHVGLLCDASFPTFNISHWCRDRSRGEQLPLETVVRGQTLDTARHVGWDDRGVLAPGYKADINVIDFDRLQLRPPQIINDLPAGGRRLVQKATGYAYTICSGTVTFEDGEHTGELPGRLVRGAPDPGLSNRPRGAGIRPLG